MKTAEITRHKAVMAAGEKAPSTFTLFMDIYRREGLAGINKGVNAVAVRQCTNWGSRIGIARLAEQGIRKIRNKEGPLDKLSPAEKILASSIGGALGTWNQPIEVVRVEMQSMAKTAAVNPNRPAKLTVFKYAHTTVRMLCPADSPTSTLGYIYKEGGIKALYRGVTPRVGLVRPRDAGSVTGRANESRVIRASGKQSAWSALRSQCSLTMMVTYC